ncbi:MAG: acetyl-CoA carboxylase carboxyltransferase subunit beta [Hyphomicrobiaceae bacterium]|nr:acetyl-CoA carboxylase carboxyltransferase subunit beta [Hyphomicrobiaceae bacterium]
MNWISNVVRPRIRSLLTTKPEVPDNMWIKCPETGQMVFYKDLESNQFVVPGSNFHIRMTADTRLKHLFDDACFEKVTVPVVPTDPLKFRDGRRYVDRLRDARSDTSLEDAVIVGAGKLNGQNVVAAVQDFRFMGGSLGMAAGETIITGMMHAVQLKTPFILFTASGGARMQEGILSLMQMPRTTIAVQKLRDNKLPYIVVLTDPTTGGVTASYAMLGDIHIAEPGALICFAGPRVIQQTIREELPEGFQRAEYLLEHGMLDMVVHRHDLRKTLSKLVNLLTVKVNKSSKSEFDSPKDMVLTSKHIGMQNSKIDHSTNRNLATTSLESTSTIGTSEIALTNGLKDSIFHESGSSSSSVISSISETDKKQD